MQKDILLHQELFKCINMEVIKMAYPVLIGEMAVNKITQNALADLLDLHRNTISYKLEKGSFTIEEAESIRGKYFPDYPMKELFKRE